MKQHLAFVLILHLQVDIVRSELTWLHLHRANRSSIKVCAGKKGHFRLKGQADVYVYQQGRVLILKLFNQNILFMKIVDRPDG